MPRQRRRGQQVAESGSAWTSTTPAVWLLDVNVLIALIDPMHSHHEPAHAWFARTGHAAWATCPLTENGVMRIIGHPAYPGGAGSPVQVAPLLARFCARPEHCFWADDLSLLDPAVADTGRLLSSGQLTDSYLLALAVHHGGQLATFDKRLVVEAVHGGREALHVIDA